MRRVWTGRAGRMGVERLGWAFRGFGCLLASSLCRLFCFSGVTVESNVELCQQPSTADCSHVLWGLSFYEKTAIDFGYTPHPVSLLH